MADKQENKQPKIVTHITLGDKRVPVNPKFNAYLLHQLRVKEGYRTRLVLNAMVRDEEIDEMALVDAVFISYRNANEDGMEYMDFLKNYELDIEEAGPLLGAILTKKAAINSPKNLLIKRQKAQTKSFPKIKIEELEDLYAVYVLLVGIDENDFWHLPLQDVNTIAMNKLAIENWRSAEQEKK